MLILLYDFLAMLLKFYCQKDSKASCPRELSCDLILPRGKQNLLVFEVFRACVREFSTVFHEIFVVARSYRVLGGKHQKFAHKCS